MVMVMVMMMMMVLMMMTMMLMMMMMTTMMAATVMTLVMAMLEQMKKMKEMMNKMSKKAETVEAEKDAKTEERLKSVDVKEHVDALLSNDSNLSDEFKNKAATIFEAALNIKATIVEEALREEFDRQLAEAKEQLEEDYEKKIDDYLNYVADTWMEENEIAIESALKVEMAENFLTGLQQMFVENHIEIPEDKADHFGEMEAKIDELEEQLNKEIDEKIALNSAMKDQGGVIAFHEKSAGLTLKQKDEFNDLVEGLEYDNIEDYGQKMDVILETYFNKPAATDTAVDESEPVDVDDEGPVTRSDPSMAAYAQAISRTLRS